MNDPILERRLEILKKIERAINGGHTKLELPWVHVANKKVISTCFRTEEPDIKSLIVYLDENSLKSVQFLRERDYG